MKILYRGKFIATFKRTHIQDQARPIIVISLLSYDELQMGKMIPCRRCNNMVPMIKKTLWVYLSENMQVVNGQSMKNKSIAGR